MRPLFFFGTLMDRDVLAVVLDRLVPPDALRPARLHDVARRRVSKDSFPLLIAAPGHSVDGVVFQPRDHQDHDRIRFFEDYDYDLQPCRPVLRGGEVLDALLCGAAPATAASDEPWELARWAAAHKEAFLEISRIYMRCYGRMTPEEAEPVWQDALRRHLPQFVG